MKLKHIVPVALFAVICFSPLLLQAATASPQGAITADDIKPGLAQPYIVKKGDTLWDIARCFFNDPEKWLKIWEQNLYITNPDLIYPGNRIWFSAGRQDQGGLRSVRPRPRAIVKPVERLEGKIDNSLLLTVLARQDFIQPEQVQGAGHIVDAENGRINFGVNDLLYAKLDQSAKAGALFDVFRSGDVIRAPQVGKAVGVLIKHLGRVKIISEADGLYRCLVVKAFEEISRGDRLRPARIVNQHIVPSFSEAGLSGKVIYIRNGAAEAGQHQVVGITLGLEQGLQAGNILSVSRAGRLVKDQLSGKEVRLPNETIGQMLVLTPQQHASIALIIKSIGPVNIGDSVHTAVAR